MSAPMNMILFAILGGFVGGALALVMPGGQRLNIVTGALTGSAGALLGGWLLVPLFRAPVAEHGIVTTAFLVAVLGATLLFGLTALTTGRVSR